MFFGNERRRRIDVKGQAQHFGRLHVAAPIALASFVSLGACSDSCGKTDPGAQLRDGAGADLPPIPAPEGLLAKGWIRNLDAAWGRVQRGAGSALLLLPPTGGGLACAAAGLDSDFAREIDGKKTALFVLAVPAERKEGLGWAVALPLVDPPRARARLFEGDAARYAPRDVGDVRVLDRKDSPQGAPGPAAGLAQGYFLLADDEEDLMHLGRYAYRTMPGEPAPRGDAAVVAVAPQAALAGPLGGRLASRWAEARAWLLARDQEQRARHGGRAPDFGDVEPILAAVDAVAKRRIDLVAGAKEARIDLDASEDEVHVELLLTPGADDAGALALGMHPGDAKPLADAPADALAAILLRDDAPARAADARDLAGAVQGALGSRLPERDARALGAGLDDWARGRGDWLTAALSWGSPAGDGGVRPSRVIVRAPAADADAAARGVRELVELARSPALKEPLATLLHVGPPALSTSDAPGGGKATLASFAPLGAQAGGAATKLGLAWTVLGGEVVVAGGSASPELLAPPSGRLGDDPRAARALSAVGANATFALVAQPLRLDPARGAAAGSAPLVLAWGRADAAVWARIEIADPLLAQAVGLRGGL
jgi:hypothetical protein